MGTKPTRREVAKAKKALAKIPVTDATLPARIKASQKETDLRRARKRN